MSSASPHASIGNAHDVKVTLRIAFVVHMYNRHKGHSRYVAELAERYSRQGHEVHVFCSVVEEPRPPGIHFHHVPSWRWKALTLILTFILPATLLVRGNFDVIHAQGLSGLRQHVTTAHECVAARLRASSRYIGKLSFGQHLARFLVVPLEWFTYRPIVSRHVIAISDANRKDLEHFYHRTRDVTVIPHGIDLAYFSPDKRTALSRPVRQELGLSENDLVALYVGELKKGCAPAIRALARIAGIHLLIVSPSDRGPYEKLAGELGVETRVHFAPETQDVARYYAAADVFVFPTCFEPFGMVISEAMAMALPVVTSACAGAATLIQHQENGWLLQDPWSADEIAQALKQFVEDPDLRARVGQAARRTAERYTWDRVAADTFTVYQKSIASRQASRRA